MTVKHYSIYSMPPLVSRDPNGIYYLKTSTGFKILRVSIVDGSLINLDANNLDEVLSAGNTTNKKIIQIDQGIEKQATFTSSVSASTVTVHRPTEWSNWNTGTGILYVKLPFANLTATTSHAKIRGRIRHTSDTSANNWHMTEFEIFVYQTQNTAGRCPIYLSNREADSKFLPIRLVYNGSDIRITFGNSLSHLGTQIIIDEFVTRNTAMTQEFESGLMTSLDGFTVLERPSEAYKYTATEEFVRNYYLNNNSTIDYWTSGTFYTVPSTCSVLRIFADPSSTIRTLNLPNPITCKGRRIRVFDEGAEGHADINLNYPIKLKYATPSLSPITINKITGHDHWAESTGVDIQSDGTDWCFVGMFY